jgi:hypothetical protein
LIDQDALDRGGQAGGVARFDEQAVLAVLDRRRNAAGTSRHYGATERAGFDQRSRRAFRQARHYEHVVAAV